MKGKHHLGDLDLVDSRITLKWILKKEDVKVCIGFTWFKTGYNSGFL